MNRSEPQKLLVTGAGGFLGRSVVRSALEQGYAVRALVRRPASASDWQTGDRPNIDDGRLEIHVGDLRDPQATNDACRDVDAVVHLAACVAGSPQQQFQSTVAGTENLLSAMTNNDVSRLVLASSFYVYDWARTRRSLTEDSPLLESPYHRDGYTISKWWQERICRAWQEQAEGELTVLRPGYIWGAENPLAPRVGFSLTGRFVVVGPWADAALTHVDNCGEYFVRAVSEEAIGATLNVVDGHRVSNSTIAKRLAQRLSDADMVSSEIPNVRRRIWLPYLCGAAISRLAAFTGRLTLGRKYRLPSLLMPTLFQARFRPLRFPNSRINNLLGPARWDFEQCLERTHSGMGDLRTGNALQGSRANRDGSNNPAGEDTAGENTTGEDSARENAADPPASEAVSLDSTEVGIS